MQPRGLALTLRTIDIGMLLYWGIAALACFGVVRLPVAAMYDGYGTAVIDAWNWSFAPVDVAFALTGLASIALARRGHAQWRPVALVSLALTFCAGLMAISFWALRGEFALAWWLPNLALVAAGLWWSVRLVRDA